MPRPLTGGLRQSRGRWWASVPDKAARSGRHYESFLLEDDARAWLTQAVAAVEHHRPVPAADGFRTVRPAKRTRAVAQVAVRRVQPDVASVAKAWMDAAYEDLRRGGPDRAERVRRVIDGYLLPWFVPRTATIADISYFMAHEWVLHLIGRTPATGSPAGANTAVAKLDGTGELTLVDAASVAGVSMSTARRRWQAGEIPGAYRDLKGQIRVPARSVTAIAVRAHRPTGLSRGYVADALWVLRQVIGFARANGLFPPGFDPTESLEAPAPDPAVARARRPTSQPRPLRLAECAQVAAHLHVVHQMVFWLQRIMGLRISEAFGVLVEDIVDLGDIGMLAAQGQGGRKFHIRDDHGAIVAVARKETMKTAAGTRVLVVPTAMMAMFRLAIDAFHTNPDTETVDTTARLVPGIMRANEAGQGGYQDALGDALAAEGLASADLGFRVSSHLLRKSLATDLAWEAGIEDAVRRRFMGHRAGDDVFGRIYTLDHPEVAPLVKVAAVLDDKIAASIGTLCTPTTRPVYWGRANPLAARDDHLTRVLGTAGWLVDPGDHDDPLCDAQRVAAELDSNIKTARRRMADGTLPVIITPDHQGVPRRMVRLSAVWAYRDRLASRVLLPDVADQLGLRYNDVWHMVRRLNITLDQHPASRHYEVPAAAVEQIRAEQQRVQALHRRSMRLSAAAGQLKVAFSTACLLLKNGDLALAAETDSSGATFVTRASVKQCWLTRHAARRRKAQRPAGIPLAEVTRFTGHRATDIMDLVRAGVLEQVPGRGPVQLNPASLRAWMDQRDDATDAAALVAGDPHDTAAPPATTGQVVPLPGRAARRSGASR